MFNTMRVSRQRRKHVPANGSCIYARSRSPSILGAYDYRTAKKLPLGYTYAMEGDAGNRPEQVASHERQLQPGNNAMDALGPPLLALVRLVTGGSIHHESWWSRGAPLYGSVSVG